MVNLRALLDICTSKCGSGVILFMEPKGEKNFLGEILPLTFNLHPNILNFVVNSQFY